MTQGAGTEETESGGRRGRLTLLRLFGFRVQIDASWMFLALLITWSLATAVFPFQQPRLSAAAYWSMGIAGALGLFASLVFHELSHSLVARRFGLAIRGITLFMFGGVAENGRGTRERARRVQDGRCRFGCQPRAGGALRGGLVLGPSPRPAPSVLVVLRYLAFINLALATFNLIPAYPLDGGRILRAALWWWKKDLRRSTRWSSQVGAGFGTFLMASGLLRALFFADLIGGLWSFLIGFFLRGAAKAAYAQLMARETLAGIPVRQIMVSRPVTVPADITIDRLVEDYILKHYHEQYPVTRDLELLGSIGTRQVRLVPRREWPRRTVAAMMVPRSGDTCIDAAADAAQALALMNRTGNTRLLVTAGDRLVGVLELKDLLKFMALRRELASQATSGP